MNSLRDLPLWCIVQADGDRVRATNAGAVPAQYWSKAQDLSLIQRSLHRATRLTNPRQIIATVAEAHQHWWSGHLWCVPPHRRVVDESSGRLTVTLAAAMALIERETGKDALVVLHPADTFHASEQAFVAGIGRALRTLERLSTHVVALTLAAFTSEPDQDYLLLGAEDGLPGTSAVRFVKRPQPLVAERLIELGARLSTGVYVARLSTLTRIIAELWPDLMTAARMLAWSTQSEVRISARMTGSQFCRPWRHTWVQRPLPRLRAVAVDDIGWSSVGTEAIVSSTGLCE